MSEKLVLIDGHSILNRAFFGIPDLTNSEGLHTNAVYGFLNILFKILEEEQPNYLTVAFDVSQPTFRHKMYTEYKQTIYWERLPRKPRQKGWTFPLSAGTGIYCSLLPTILKSVFRKQSAPEPRSRIIIRRKFWTNIM